MITQHEIAKTGCASARILNVPELNDEYYKCSDRAKSAFQLLRNAFQVQCENDQPIRGMLST